MMRVTEGRIGNVLVLSIDGRLNAETADQLQGQLQAVLDRGETALLVELGDLDYISSAGMRVLLIAAKQLAETGQFAICGLNKSVSEIFRISGFDTIIDVFTDAGTALAAFKS